MVSYSLVSLPAKKSNIIQKEARDHVAGTNSASIPLSCPSEWRVAHDLGHAHHWRLPVGLLEVVECPRRVDIGLLDLRSLVSVVHDGVLIWRSNAGRITSLRSHTRGHVADCKLVSQTQDMPELVGENLPDCHDMS